MAHPDSLLDLFKPVLWLMLASFLIGFAGMLAMASPGGGTAPASTELAAALDASGQPIAGG